MSTSLSLGAPQIRCVASLDVGPCCLGTQPPPAPQPVCSRAMLAGERSNFTIAFIENSTQLLYTTQWNIPFLGKLFWNEFIICPLWDPVLQTPRHENHRCQTEWFFFKGGDFGGLCTSQKFYSHSRGGRNVQVYIQRFSFCLGTALIYTEVL